MSPKRVFLAIIVAIGAALAAAYVFNWAVGGEGSFNGAGAGVVGAIVAVVVISMNNKKRSHGRP